MDNTVTVKGQQYGIMVVPVDVQFHLARRISPILAALGISMDMLKGGALSLPDLDQLTTSMGPVSQVLAHMDDATVNYVLANTLTYVRREQVVDGKSLWAPVVPAHSPTSPVFSDIDMPAMLRLVVEVLTVNLMGFSLERGALPPSTRS